MEREKPRATPVARRGLDDRVEALGSDQVRIKCGLSAATRDRYLVKVRVEACSGPFTVIQEARNHRRFWMFEVESRRTIELQVGIRSRFIPVTFRPFGGKIVSIEEADRRGLSQQAAAADQPAC